MGKFVNLDISSGDGLSPSFQGHGPLIHGQGHTFNGIQPPSIAVFEPEDGSMRVVRSFGYEDFKGRLF